MSDGVCYEVQDAAGIVNSNVPVSTHSDCATCNATVPTPAPAPTPAPSPTPSPTPAPTPAPVASCNAISLEGPFASPSGPPEGWTCSTSLGFFMNTSDWCTATRLDRTSSCDRLALPGYYTNGSFTRHWDGSAFTTSCTVTNCP